MRMRSILVVLGAAAAITSPVALPRGGPPERCAFEGSGVKATHHLRTKPVLGRFWIQETDSDEIAWVHPVTLRPLNTDRMATPMQSSVWAVSPSGHLLAIALRRGIQVVDTRSLMSVATLQMEDRRPRALSWLSNDLLAGVVEGEVGIWGADGARVRSIQLREDERLMGWQATTGRLVALVSPDPRNEEPSRLLDVRSTGIGVIELDRVVGGHVPDVGEFGTSLTPDLAYDPGRGRAFVVQPDGPVAEVDLDRRTVSYHTLGTSLLEGLAARLVPPAEAKVSDWATSRAAWLGGGLLAISGETGSALHPVAGFSAGITLVDTRDWSSCVLHTRASHVAVTGGSLLAWGGGDFGELGGVGLIGYDLADGRRWHRFGRQYLDMRFLGGYAYAINSWHGWHVSTVDVATGRVLAERRGRPPTLLPSGAAAEAV
jgi:hypothetical protein